MAAASGLLMYWRPGDVRWEQALAVHRFVVSSVTLRLGRVVEVARPSELRPATYLDGRAWLWGLDWFLWFADIGWSHRGCGDDPERVAAAMVEHLRA